MNKSLKYLIVAFGVLLLLYFINQFQQNKYVAASDTIFDIDENIIDKILLKDSSGDSIVLFKTDSLWSILDNDTLIVKDRQIDQFFEKVISGTSDMMISKNPDKWITFGVDSSSGKLLKVFQKDKLIAATMFSNKGQDYSHNFYRNIGADIVYRTSENIFYMLNTRPTYWGSKPKEIPTDIIDSVASPN
jgi:hypothetical protein